MGPLDRRLILVGPPEGDYRWASLSRRSSNGASGLVREVQLRLAGGKYTARYRDDNGWTRSLTFDRESDAEDLLEGNGADTMVRTSTAPKTCIAAIASDPTHPWKDRLIWEDALRTALT